MIKKSIVCLFAAASCAMLLSASAMAQDSKVGYVEIKEIFTGYKKAQTAQESFKKEIEAEQKKITDMEASIKSLQAEFEKNKDILQPDEKSKQEAQLREKVQEFSGLWSKTNKSLDARRQELEEKILDEIKAEIKSYGKKLGYTAILDSRVVLYGQAGTDITQEIIKELNKK